MSIRDLQLSRCLYLLSSRQDHEALAVSVDEFDVFRFEGMRNVSEPFTVGCRLKMECDVVIWKL